MAKVTRIYSIVCPSCGGSGWINSPRPVSASATEVCPACKGNKTTIVTEIVEGDSVLRT